MIIKLLFWICLAGIIYTYFGYGIILWIISQIKHLYASINHRVSDKNELSAEPHVSLLIPAYNEQPYIPQKIANSRNLDYPSKKLHQVWITDGSDDGSDELLRTYPEVTLLHKHERTGKIGAINRGMHYIKTPVVIFTDANTMLHQDTVREIVYAFRDPEVGCVAGEKRIKVRKQEGAVNSGEGIYWQIESLIKQVESKVGSVMGAAGELFAIRTELFQPVEPDTLLDDFIISLRIAKQGYKTKYAPKAFGEENASISIKEEMKRKIRIAAGGLQAISRLKALLNPFKYGFLSLQFISHKVLRWTFVPFAIILLFISNLLIVLQYGFEPAGFYFYFFMLQIFYYIMVVVGSLLQNRKLAYKLVFAPYYVFIMNYSILAGYIKYFFGKQTVNWEKAKRNPL